MSDKRTLEKHFLKNVSWLFSGKSAAGLFAAIETIIVARLLGVENYGLLAILVAYVDLVNNFLDLRVWETATKYIGSYWAKNEKDKTLSMVKLSYFIDISTGFIAFILTIVTSKIASNYLLHSQEAYYYICIYAFSLLIDTANTTSYAILRVFDKYKDIAFISTVNNFVRLLFVCIVLYLEMGLTGVLYSYVASTAITFILRMTFVAKSLRKCGLFSWWNADIRLIRDEWKGIAWFLGNTSLTATFKMAGDNYAGILILGYFAGKEASAYYKVGRAFLNIIGRVTEPLTQVIFPELVRLSNFDDLSHFKHLIKYSIKNLSKVLIPVAIVVIIFSDWIIKLIYGIEYLPASDVLKIITPAVVISNFIFWINPALLALGNPGLRTISGLLSLTIYLLLMLILVQEYSYIGAAIAFLGYTLARTVISSTVLKISLKRRNDLARNMETQEL